MKTPLRPKHLFLMALTLGVAVGCATTPPEPAATAPSAQADAASQAISAAKAAMAEAKALGWEWRDTGKMLAAAEKALAGGDYDAAIASAKQAENQAKEAVNQYYLEKAKVLMQEAQMASGLGADQQSTLRSAANAIANGEGRKAYDLLTPLVSELRNATIQYTVVRGDSLWGISGKREVYNNPYQWPLIFKANRSQIEDADLIHPGQNFSIDRNPSAAEVDAAVNHAKTRGAWSIGVTEESDKAYLGGSLELR